MSGHSFRPNQRIRRRVEFQHVYERGVRIQSRYGTFFFLPNSLGRSRLGVAATRKLGGAIARNRAKRLIREVFRLSIVAQSIDIVVVPKRELLDASLTAFEPEYRAVVERYLRRSPKSSRSSA